MEMRGSLGQHFKKKKSRMSSGPSRMNARRSNENPTFNSPLKDPVSTSSVSSPTVSNDENNAIGDALSALTMSLQLDLENFAPPTPAVSPVNTRAGKRARFDFGSCEEANEDETRVKKVAAPSTCGALLALSNRIKRELENRRNHGDPTGKRQRRFRKHLNYFSIASAFQRAALEREVNVVHSVEFE
jgi:hypothetical protein